jgi:hypothetical protein
MGLIAATPFTGALADQASQSPKTTSEQKTQLVQNYAKLPLSFETNAGQVNRSVKFLSRGSGYGLFLTTDEAVLTLRNPRLGVNSAGAAPCDVVRMRLAGASGKTEPMGQEQLPGTVNYFIGSDSAKWRANVPTYARVRYADTYPGIDLVYYGSQRQLEYDFVAAPGADPNLIRLRFTGAKKLRVGGDGNLVVTAANGALTFQKPLVYQMVDGQRHSIAGEFALLRKDTVGFRLGSYNHAKSLVIDPVLVYSTYLGGSGGDPAKAIAVDAAGNAYVAGTTAPTGFPVTEGAFQTTENNTANAPYTAFVTKLNPAGTALVYSTYLGGSGGDSASALAVDSSGNAYVTGSTFSTDFPLTQRAYQATNKAAANQDSNAFIAKLNPSGTALVYSTYLGGSGIAADTPYSGDIANSIAVDAAGDAFVAGKAYSTDFPVSQGAFQTTNKSGATGGRTAFITELNAAGTDLLYSTYLGGSSGDAANAITVDSVGDAYVAGQTASTDFPVTPGVFQAKNHASANYYANAFVTKLNPTGTELLYSTYLGGSGTGCCIGDSASALAVDAFGNAYVAGVATSIDFPVTQGAFQSTNHFGFGSTGEPSSSNGPNAFVAKLNPLATELVYSTYLGGRGGIVNLTPILMMAGGDQATGLAVDSSGDAYVTGSTASANFPVTPGAYQTANNDQTVNSIGGYNAFVTELNPAGSGLVYSTYLGGNGVNPGSFIGILVFGSGDQASALALDGSSNVYVTGTASSGNFPVTGGAYQTEIPSSASALIAKLDLSATSTAATPTVTVTPAPTNVPSALPLTVTVAVSGGSGNPTPTGTVTLANGAYSSTATLSGGSAIFDIPAAVLAAFACYPTTPADLLTANYLPDAASSSTYKFASGMGNVYMIAPCVTVTPSATTLTLTQAQSQPLSVLIAATSVNGLPVPSGTVILTAGSFVSAPATLAGGQATITIPAGTLQAGYNEPVADYAGDSNYLADYGNSLITVTPLGSDDIFWIDTTPITIAPGATTGNVSEVLILPKNGSMTGTVTLACALIATPSNPTSPVTCGIPSSWIIDLAAVSPALTVNSTAATTPGSYVVEITLTWGSVIEKAVVDVTVTVASARTGFTITNSGKITLAPGATTGNTSTITVTPAGGFTGNVALSAALTSSPNGAQSLPALSFGSTSPVSITGASAGTATLTITTTAGGGCTQAYQIQRPVPWYAAGGAALACLLLFGIPARRRSWRTMLGMMALLFALGSGVLACGGNSGSSCVAVTSPGTTPGTYTITVTGTSSGTAAATSTLTLTVQ